MERETWHNVEQKLPDLNGSYLCLVKRGERILEVVRHFKSGHWFGGCRPFSDHDKVIQWRSEN